jgi:hypothetical protein
MAGGVPIQGVAIRVTALNADGSPGSSSTSMYANDRPFCKLTLKPELANGVDITPISAGGIPLIAYKDVDRFKRWNVELTMGDWDPAFQQIVTQQGAVIAGASSSGRTFADGVTTLNSNIVTSPALAAFVTTDVGRAVTGTGIPGSTVITEYVSATEVRINNLATATATGVSITLGAQPTGTIGYQYPHTLIATPPYGVSIEVWQRVIIQGTGYPGTEPYPSSGGPSSQPSAFLRWGIPRVFQYTGGTEVDNKEDQFMYTGWAIENPNWFTGPNDDWRVLAVAGSAGGAAIDTTACVQAIADFALPSPLQPGYQTPAV